MANSLLDFVMSLVRDPDAAARYAADPDGAIADAHLTDVTSADVNNLIPMVADSMSMATPAVGGGAGAEGAEGNVWTTGAATAAFDAFDAFGVHTPADRAGHDTGSDSADVIQQPADPGHAPIAGAGPEHRSGEVAIEDPSAQLDDAGLGHLSLDDPAQQWSDHGGWGDPHADPHDDPHDEAHTDPHADTHTDDSHPGGDHPGFDLF